MKYLIVSLREPAVRLRVRTGEHEPHPVLEAPRHPALQGRARVALLQQVHRLDQHDHVAPEADFAPAHASLLEQLVRELEPEQEVPFEVLFDELDLVLEVQFRAEARHQLEYQLVVDCALRAQAAEVGEYYVLRVLISPQPTLGYFWTSLQHRSFESVPYGTTSTQGLLPNSFVSRAYRIADVREHGVELGLQRLQSAR